MAAYRRLLRPTLGTIRKGEQQLVLLRHGETMWTRENRYSSWVDVPLTAKGAAKSQLAGAMMREEGLGDIDVVYTSVLSRSIKSAWAVLEELDRMYVPVHRCAQLSERHYGALTGMSKKESTLLYGEENIKAWRRSFDAAPPPLDPSHPLYDKVMNDGRFRELSMVPTTESLSDVITRLLPLWAGRLARDLSAGKRVLVCAHSNSLRALITLIQGLSREQVMGLNVPTSIPLVLDLDERLQPRAEMRALGSKEEFERRARAVAEEATVRPEALASVAQMMTPPTTPEWLERRGKAE